MYEGFKKDQNWSQIRRSMDKLQVAIKFIQSQIHFQYDLSFVIIGYQ